MDGGRRHPRGLPAASLKHHVVRECQRNRARHPRGLPAASLKHDVDHQQVDPGPLSSAGITRGLIEALRIPTLASWIRRVIRGDYPRPH